MNSDETARLVNLLISTWPAGVKGYVWTDTLGPLDQAAAATAYRDLRQTEERPPSVARFLAAYHAARSAARRASDGPPSRCELCDGTGLVSSPPERAHNPRVCHPTEERPCCCTATDACRCSAGDERRPMLAGIREHNDRTRPRHLAEQDEQQPRRLAAEQEALNL